MTNGNTDDPFRGKDVPLGVAEHIAALSGWLKTHPEDDEARRLIREFLTGMDESEETSEETDPLPDWTWTEETPPPPRRWLVQHWMPAARVSMLAGRGGGADRGRYLVFPASGRWISSGQGEGRDVVQEATIPLCLFSTEKVPESHFPSKSTVSIPTPVRGGGGKSRLALQLAAGVASGGGDRDEWICSPLGEMTLGTVVPEDGAPVVYATWEDDEEEFHRRLVEISGPEAPWVTRELLRETFARRQYVSSRASVGSVPGAARRHAG